MGRVRKGESKSMMVCIFNRFYLRKVMTLVLFFSLSPLLFLELAGTKSMRANRMLPSRVSS